MDYHPKKKIKKNNRANQKSNHGHVVGRDQDSLLYTKQKQIKPHYPTLQYRGVYRKKKRNQILSKRETKYRAKKKPQTPRANQTHGGAAIACRRSSLRDLRRSSSSRRPSLARRRRSSLARRRLPVVADQNGLTISAVPVLSQSASRYFSPFFSLTLSLSLSLSH